MNWIDEQRKARIAQGEPKYGPWTAYNFQGRNPITEAIDEALDLLNYLEMASMKEYRGYFRKWDVQVREMLEELKCME